MRSMNGRIASWLVFMKFGGDPTPENIGKKLLDKFRGAETTATIIADDGMPGAFLDYYMGSFQIPVFVVIDPSSKTVVSITGNNDYGWYNPQKAFEDAKAAVQRLLEQAKKA